MPYAPTVNDRSGEIMAQGIMRAGGSITDAIEKHKAEGKKLKAYRAMAVDGLGLDPEEVDQMDLPTLEGKMQSLAVQNVMGQMKQRQQQEQFAIEDQGFQRDANQRAQAEAEYQAKQRQAGAAMMQDPAFRGVGPTGPVQPDFNPQSIMASAAKHGVAPEQALPILKLMMEGQTRQPRGVAFTKSPSGADIAYSPDTGAFQFDPFSKAEADAKASKGKLTGKRVPVLDKFTGEPTGEYQMILTGDAETLAEYEKKLAGEKPTPPAGANPEAKGKPTRALAADLVKKHGSSAAALAELKKQGYDITGYAD